MKNYKLTYKWQKIVTMVAAMFGLGTLGFNCAPSLFENADYSYLNNGATSFDTFGDSKLSPWVLQNTGQVLETFASVSGFSGAITANQRAEYDARTGSFSQTDKVSDINAPLQLGSTSLAGEFCSSIIARESAAGAARQFFNGVNFAAAPSAGNAGTFSSSIVALGNGFWGRPPNPEEAAILNAYYNDFVATAGTQAAQTRNLYLSTCSAMLASFDSITY